MPADNFSDGVLANTKISGNPSVTATCFNRFDDFGVKFVGFRAHAYLPPELTPSGTRSGEA
ncbi:hypothetical protein ALP29_201503 [Pseudomonas syringae pv. avii]|uniref:Uncharacterized protein n=3 Tax=Pseudomonas TaxID=286 RepID=A0A3M5VQC0_PSESX|nr:hypothetical protein ALP29_201503 [Pseudomonas syringae pv. avii]SOS30369.1 hypothetical protein PL963_P300091 [Pseudomonas cerasi]